MGALVARARWLLARHPSLYWATVAVAVLVAATTVRGAVREAEAQRDRWGTTRVVWVVTAPTERGAPIAAEARELPVAVLPATPLDTAPTAPASRRLGVGEILVADDVAAVGTVPADWVVMSVDDDAAPRLVIGDGVVVFADGERLCPGVVVTTDDERFEVAVDERCAARVSAAGMVVLGRSP